MKYEINLLTRHRAIDAQSVNKIQKARDNLSLHLESEYVEFIGHIGFFQIFQNRGEKFNNIYMWKYEYTLMKWDELIPIVKENIINFKNMKDPDGVLEYIRLLHSITELANTFEIYEKLK